MDLFGVVVTRTLPEITHQTALEYKLKLAVLRVLLGSKLIRIRTRLVGSYLILGQILVRYLSDTSSQVEANLAKIDVSVFEQKRIHKFERPIKII